MVAINFDQALFFPQQEFQDEKAVLKFLSQQLITQGYAKKGYTEAILTREATYPTGLPSPEPRVAIPHADSNFINHTTIAVATLAKPVAFHNMEDVDAELDVSIVMMLAIKEPHGQVEMLQNVVGIIQNNQVMREIAAATSSAELYRLVTNNL